MLKTKNKHEFFEMKNEFSVLTQHEEWLKREQEIEDYFMKPLNPNWITCVDNRTMQDDINAGISDISLLANRDLARMDLKSGRQEYYNMEILQ